jgi:hydrogenase maturation protease
MGDEGVGLRVVGQLAADPSARRRADCIDAGPAGMKLLHLMDGRRRAILVDCALMGEPPGTWRRFVPADVRSVKRLAGFSLHEGDLLSILELARSLGTGPAEVVIVGIEPLDVEPRLSLSPLLEQRMAEYVQAVRRELAPMSA